MFRAITVALSSLPSTPPTPSFKVRPLPEAGMLLGFSFFFASFACWNMSQIVFRIRCEASRAVSWKGCVSV